MRKAFRFIPWEDVVTPVYDAVSCAIPDQSLSLREMMMRFAYIGNERLSEIINRGYDGDEDDDLLGVDVSALDFAEVHDRIMELRGKDQTFARSAHAPVIDNPVTDKKVDVADIEGDSPETE